MISLCLVIIIHLVRSHIYKLPLARQIRLLFQIYAPNYVMLFYLLSTYYLPSPNYHP